MYLLEKDHPESLMTTYADSLWWGVVIKDFDIRLFNLFYLKKYK